MTLYDELIARGLIAQVTDEEKVKELINSGKATFYIGFDPTADSLHVGHFMALCLMRRLQSNGNKPIALLGGGTALIGDPSGKTDMRKMLTAEDINHNAECFKKQMSRFIDFSDGKALMVNNADWLLGLNYVELLREVGACFSVNNMLRAECYKQRMEKGLTFLEFNYMIMQSYDFYHLFQHYNCNMQFGGNDQWSNMLGGTELIRKKLGKDAHCMTITLLTDSQGNKMGKTAGNAVWLDANKTSPYDFYYMFQHYGCNMQFGGDDQWSNMLGGTELIRRKLGKDAHAMTITLLLNSEGKKMGKTAKGAVWLDPNKTSPYEFYQYWRNVDDADVMKCIRMLTFLPLEQINEMDSWKDAKLNKAKEILAFELTKLVHGEEEAQKAQNAAKALFVGGGDDANIPTTEITEDQLTEGKIGLLSLMVACKLAASNGDARKNVAGGGVSVNDEKITDVKFEVTREMLKEGVKLRKGKKVFHKAILK